MLLLLIPRLQLSMRWRLLMWLRPLLLRLLLRLLQLLLLLL
jgi:hypothetical protein